MKILYGVVGEGMGHATRSRVLLEHLVKHHEVQIVVSGRAKAYLEKYFASVHGIWGLTLAYEGNRVKRLDTLVENLKGAVKGIPGNVKRYFDLVESFAPDAVVSDFESFSYLFARNHFLPVISVDNMQIINRAEHSPVLLAGHEKELEITRGIVKSKLPGCFQYLITTFFYPPVHKKRTTLIPSILRSEILEAKSEPGEHLIVYQTATVNSALPNILKKAGVPCRVYGLRRDLTEDVVDGNVTYRPFSETRFIEDLRTSRAVVSGGGFTLMSEAVYLKKPMLSVPVTGQFEQVLNALYLAQLRYGEYHRSLTPDGLKQFLDKTGEYRKALEGYHQDGNRLAHAALDDALSRAAEFRGKWGIPVDESA